MHYVTIPGTFVEVQLPSNALLYKEGYIRKKNIMEGPHKKGIVFHVQCTCIHVATVHVCFLHTHVTQCMIEKFISCAITFCMVVKKNDIFSKTAAYLKMNISHLFMYYRTECFYFIVEICDYSFCTKMSELVLIQSSDHLSALHTFLNTLMFIWKVLLGWAQIHILYMYCVLHKDE